MKRLAPNRLVEKPQRFVLVPLTIITILFQAVLMNGVCGMMNERRPRYGLICSARLVVPVLIRLHIISSTRVVVPP